MDIEKAKELAILESEKYAHRNGFGKEKGKIQTAFLAGFELAFKNNVALDSVSGSIPPLDTYERVKDFDDMKQKDIKKREDQGYKFTPKKRELYEIGYLDCYESLRRE